MAGVSAPLIRDHYRADHRRLDNLFQQFQRLKRIDLAQAAECFRQFQNDLQQHIQWEEQILFPRFDEKTGQRELSRTMVLRLEHQRIQNLLATIAQKLQRRDIGTEREVTLLENALVAHNAQEEHLLYPALDQLLSESERRLVFASMRRKQAEPR